MYDTLHEEAPRSSSARSGTELCGAAPICAAQCCSVPGCAVLLRDALLGNVRTTRVMAAAVVVLTPCGRCSNSDAEEFRLFVAYFSDECYWMNQERITM